MTTYRALPNTCKYRAHTKRRTTNGRTIEPGKPYLQEFQRFRLYMRYCFECLRAFVKNGVPIIILLCDQF